MLSPGPSVAALCSPSADATREGGANTAAIAPSPGSAPMSEPRAAANRSPSSRPSTPAVCAAAISPRLCPSTTSGRTPGSTTARSARTPARRSRAASTSDRRGLRPRRAGRTSRRGARRRRVRRGAARRSGPTPRGTRLALVERRAHAHPLAGLSGVDERDLRRRPRPECFLRLHERLEPLAQRRRVTEHHSRAMIEMAASGAGGPRRVGEERIGGGAFGRQLFVAFVEP